MKKIAILLCVSLLIFTGCSGKKMRKDTESSTGDSNANRYRESEVYRHGDLILLKANNLPLTGFLKRFDDKKGYLSEESYYVNGLLCGLSKHFSENGSLSYSKNYLNGKLQGWYKDYNKDGALVYESYYEDGEQTRSTGWYDNGIKSYEYTYKNGETNGKSISWYETGKLKSVFNYIEGKRIGWQSAYSESGEVLYEVNLINGNGKISYKLPGTDITINEEYLNGKRVSPENGKVIENGFGRGTIFEKTFENGELNGVYTRRNLQSEKIYHETNFKNGLKHGKQKSWHNNGQLSEEGQYENDLEHGIWQEWYENGKLKSLITYNYGKRVSRKCWDESGKSIKCD
jgi:antitoxin component YwqK of YwqJK toxin-antitoxin module